ncbi:HAD family hydrolase [Chloroflexota bacterium]
MTKLVLFDIDGTLVNAAGAGRIAMSSSIETLYGVSNAADDVDFIGRSDLYILRRALTNAGIPPERLDEALTTTRAEYFRILPGILKECNQGRALEGVVEVLEGLRYSVQIGLATGNFRESAFMKLEHYGLEGYFSTGGFGDDAEERAEIVYEAIRRCKELAGLQQDITGMYLVGDSPRDVMGGKAVGIKTVAVASGWTSLEELAIYEPTVLLPDLSCVSAFFKAVGVAPGQADNT